MNDPDEIDLREPHVLDQPLPTCPTCGSTRLTTVLDFEDVQLFCEDCSRCWHVELNRVHRVDPNTCSHCAHFGKCAAVFAADRDVRPYLPVPHATTLVEWNASWSE
jgi:ferredoxin